MEAQQLAAEWGMPYIEVSGRTGLNVNKVEQKCVRVIVWIPVLLIIVWNTPFKTYLVLEANYIWFEDKCSNIAKWNFMLWLKNNHSINLNFSVWSVESFGCTKQFCLWHLPIRCVSFNGYGLLVTFSPCNMNISQTEHILAVTFLVGYEKTISFRLISNS